MSTVEASRDPALTFRGRLRPEIPTTGFGRIGARAEKIVPGIGKRTGVRCQSDAELRDDPLLSRIVSRDDTAAIRHTDINNLASANAVLRRFRSRGRGRDLSQRRRAIRDRKR